MKSLYAGCRTWIIRLIGRASRVPETRKFLLILIAVCSVLVCLGCGARKPPEPATRLVPMDQKVATGQLQVEAGKAVNYRIDVQPDMQEPRLKGSFMASGGSGNDVTAALADEKNIVNWVNGHEAELFWGTKGQTTTDDFDIRLKPGTYFLAISNTFSKFTNKTVSLEVDLLYQRKELVQP